MGEHESIDCSGSSLKAHGTLWLSPGQVIGRISVCLEVQADGLCTSMCKFRFGLAAACQHRISYGMNIATTLISSLTCLCIIQRECSLKRTHGGCLSRLSI